MIGAVVGVGLAKQGRGINVRILGKIAAGWIAAPVGAFLLTFVSLFFVQNVFEQRVIADSRYQVSNAVLTAAAAEGVPVEPIRDLIGATYGSAMQLRGVCEGRGDYSRADENIILGLARIDSLLIDSVKVGEILAASPPPVGILRALLDLHGEVFLHPCDLEEKLRSTVLRTDSTTFRLIDGLTRAQLDSLIVALRTMRR
jgi:PiT family inorganic phosphate transporter